MTYQVSDVTPISRYTANGVQTLFTVPFEWELNADLKVYLNGVLQSGGYTPTGAQTTGGGNVTFSVAPANGVVVTILRDKPISRASDAFTPFGALPAETLEGELDVLTMKLQQVERDNGFALRIDPTQETTTPAGMVLGAPATRKGKYLFFNATTGAIEYAAAVVGVTLTQSLIGGIYRPQSAAELAAGVTPTNFFYDWGDVRRYGGIGDGSNDDTTAFTRAGTVGVGLIPTTGYSWKLSAFVSGIFIADGHPRFKGVGYVRYSTPSGSPYDDTDNGIKGVQFANPTVLILGDSITEGSFAATYKEGYSYGLARSMLNAQRSAGFDHDQGYGYHSIINLQNALLEGGISTTGSVSTTGLSSSRISLAAGQTITITSRQMSYVDVIYDGAVSSGSISFALNGAAAYATKAVSGALLNTTFSTAINSGALCSETDTIVITAVGGTVVVTALLCLKTSASTPTIFVAGKSGTTYSDYTAAGKITEMAFYLNSLSHSSSEKLVLFALGTNSIYNAGKTQTPAQMVTDLQTIITGLQGACTNLRFVVWIPPRANETLFPVINTTYTYGDYVQALLNYVNAQTTGNAITVIRLDKSFLSTGLYYTDGLHPHAIGHRVLCQAICDALAIPYNPTVKQAALGVGYYPQADIIMNSTWGPSGGSATVRAACTRIGPQVFLSGQVQPNGSVSTTVGTLPASMRPPYAMNPTTHTDAGPIRLTINTNGTIVVPAVPATYLILDGVSFTSIKPS